MAINFQYNKTALQQLDKQLKVRVRALPTLKNKESALRIEVKRAKDTMKQMEAKLENKIRSYDEQLTIWGEFDSSLLSIEDVNLSVKKIAGVKTPVLEGIEFHLKQFSLFNKPDWFLDGISQVKELAEIAIESEVFKRKMELLDYARKKTTQKVNLFEKVQIPGYQD
ncbi:MAG: V-type ATP synthase subunit D, partial [Bacteroidota bacterium]